MTLNTAGLLQGIFWVTSEHQIVYYNYYTTNITLYHLTYLFKQSKYGINKKSNEKFHFGYMVWYKTKKGNLLYEYRDGSNFSGHVETMIKSLVIYNSYNLCLRFDALLVCFKMQDWKMVLSFVVVFSAQCPFVFWCVVLHAHNKHPIFIGQYSTYKKYKIYNNDLVITICFPPCSFFFQQKNPTYQSFQLFLSNISDLLRFC